MADASGQNPHDRSIQPLALPPRNSAPARRVPQIYDSVADLKLAARFLASIETGRPSVDLRIRALAVAVYAIAGNCARRPVDDVQVRWDDAAP